MITVTELDNVLEVTDGSRGPMLKSMLSQFWLLMTTSPILVVLLVATFIKVWNGRRYTLLLKVTAMLIVNNVAYTLAGIT